MAPKRKVSHSEKHELPPVIAPPMLQRKSSSVSVLDISGGASGKTEQKADLGFPSLDPGFPQQRDRKTNSLQDLRPNDNDNIPKGNKTQSAHGDKKKKPPKNGWSNETGDSLPMVAKTSGSQGEGKPIQPNNQRARTRRRKAGDIILTRPATIAVVVKYQCEW
ncbi:unnamed protein product [Phytophthora lilii]|uniref:Unnamed protein product n=1 Tax=Phytophthora lilii TaxID=2077276 RepID=A0A9W6TI37_9STRA|nr:unnamed protein product [Phytophthora lilii]